MEEWCPVSYTASMKLQSLRALIAIAEHGSFSEAALELDVAQSSLSYAIAELEEELGVRLLDRGRFGAIPTDVGRRIVGHARNLDMIIDAIGQEAALEHGSLGGTLRVSAFRSVATQVLPSAIAHLGSLHPDLRIDVQEVSSRSVSVTDALHAGTVDVALTMRAVAKDAIYWELFRDPYVAVVPAESTHPSEGVSVASLSTQPVILSDGPCSWPAREALVSCDPNFVPSFEISEDSTILAMVAEGLGVAIMPELTLDTLPARVRRVPILEHVERSVGVALLPGALKVPSVRAWLLTLRTAFPESEVPFLAKHSDPTIPRPMREAEASRS